MILCHKQLDNIIFGLGLKANEFTFQEKGVFSLGSGLTFQFLGLGLDLGLYQIILSICIFTKMENISNRLIYNLINSIRYNGIYQEKIKCSTEFYLRLLCYGNKKGWLDSFLSLFCVCSGWGGADAKLIRRAFKFNSDNDIVFINLT